MLYVEELRAEKKARDARFAAAANRLNEKPLPQQCAISPPVRVEPPKPVDAWAERQKQRFPIKPIWFSITDGPRYFEQRSLPFDDVNESITKRPTVRQIQLAVCRYYNIPLDDMLSDRRTLKVVMPRHIAIYLARILTIKSLPEIGRRFSGRDHTTAMNAIGKIERLLEQDAQLAADVETIKQQLGGV